MFHQFHAFSLNSGSKNRESKLRAKAKLRTIQCAGVIHDSNSFACARVVRKYLEEECDSYMIYCLCLINSLK